MAALEVSAPRVSDVSGSLRDKSWIGWSQRREGADNTSRMGLS